MLLVVIATVCPAFAAGGVTGSLNGTLVDSTRKAPLADVTVRAVSQSVTFSTRTNNRGFFSFLQLPTDTYTVSFEKNGYAATVLPGVTLLGDQT